MTEPADQAAALDAACKMFAIPMRPEWRDATLTHFVTITTAARFVADFPLDDEADVAPTFQP